MKYFVTLVYLKTEGTYAEEKDAFDRSTAMYDNFDSAENGFHQAVSTAIAKKTGDAYAYKKAIVFMYDSDGSVKFKRVWERGVVA